MRPWLERLRFVALAALGTLIAHDAVFAAQYGLGHERDVALAATSHGYWPAFVALTLLVATAGAGTAAAAIVRLRRLLRGLPAAPAVPGRTSYLREVARLWPRLLLVVAAVFVVQENLEHVAAGQAPVGLWALSAPGYPLAIPVLVAVTGLLAVVGGWLRWQHETLVRRLVAARASALRRHHDAHTPHGRWALVAALVAHRWILLRRDAERAPPVPAAA
jgi:hypothetical protein